MGLFLDLRLPMEGTLCNSWAKPSFYFIWIKSVISSKIKFVWRD